jgi:hypothetical protein
MALGEGEDFLFTLLADQTPNIFKAIRACFELQCVSIRSQTVCMAFFNFGFMLAPFS